MRNPLRLAPPLLALLLAACGHLDVRTQHDATAARAAAGYRTYAWKPPEPGEQPRSFSPDAQQVDVVKSVDAYLQSRGYQRVEAGASPDFLIRWGGALTGTIIRMPGLSGDPMTPMDPGYIGGGAESRYAGSYARRPRPVDSEVPKGILDLDILDASTKKPVWHGRAQGELSEGAMAGDVQDWLNKAISKLLSDFPPEAGKN